MKNQDTFINIIQAVMPGEAEIHANIISGDLVVSVDWLLNNDPEKGNKRSKTITIKISRNAVDDFNEMPEGMQEKALDTLEKILTNNLSSFDPDHNTPYNSPKPVKEWVITSGMLQQG